MRHSSLEDKIEDLDAFHCVCPCPGEVWLSPCHVAGNPQIVIKATRSGALTENRSKWSLAGSYLGGHERLCRGSRRMNLWFATSRSSLNGSESNAGDCSENQLRTVKSLLVIILIWRCGSRKEPPGNEDQKQVFNVKKISSR